MPIKTINDRNSEMLPSVAELRATQKKGMAGEGMNEYDCTDLNAVQGHKADIKEFTEGEKRASLYCDGMMDNEDADVSRLSRTNMSDHPEITEL